MRRLPLLPVFLFMGGIAAFSAVWFLAFPIHSKFDLADIALEGLYLTAAVVSYFLIVRLGLRLLAIGWPIFTAGVLVDFLDEFTRESDFFNDSIEDLFTSFGLSLVAVGFFLSYRRRQEELEQLRQTSKVAEEGRRWLEATLESIADGVIAADLHGRTQFMNEQAQRITGLSARDAHGRPVADVLALMEPQGGEAAPDLAAQLLADPEASLRASDYAVTLGDGPERLVEVAGTAIHAESGAPAGALMVMRDVTDRRAFEKEMLRANRVESVGLLAGGVAHDFNNIMAAILNWIAYSESVGKPDADTREAFGEIRRACARAKQLSTQLMSLSKGGDPVKVPTEVGKLVREAVDFVLKGSGVRCDYGIDKDLWIGDVDPGQFSQLAQNLVLNSREAMSDGGTVRVSLQNRVIDAGDGLPLPPGRYLALEVRDEGEGIPPENIDRLFDPYFSTKGRGHGLGLSTSYAIVKRHGGHVQVESDPTGTAFLVLVPAAGAAEPAAPLKPAGPAPRALSLLLVDDDEAVREPLRAALAQRGHRVVGAGSGRDAVEHYREALRSGLRFDAVVMDLTMPGELNGRDAMQEILQLDGRAVGVVASGYHEDPVMARHREFGFQAVLRKPYEVDDLCSTIETSRTSVASGDGAGALGEGVL